MDQAPPKANLPFELALEIAVELALEVLDSPYVSGVSVFGSVAGGLLRLPPPERVGDINIVIESRTLWTEFRDLTGNIIGRGIDFQPRLNRFLNARWLLCFEGKGLVKVDPLAQFAFEQDPDLWVDAPGGPQPLLDLFILPPDWKDPNPYFTSQICTRSFLEVIVPQAVPFKGRSFVPKTQEIRAPDYL